jgi:hypothetical protein
VIISKDVRSSLSQDVGRVKSAVIRGTVCNDHAFQPSRVRYARRYLRVYLLQLFLLTLPLKSHGVPEFIEGSFKRGA